MPQRKKPKIEQFDIDRAVNELTDILDLESLSEVDRFFAVDLLNDYGKWDGIAQAAWRSIVDEGLTVRQSSGGKGNRHYRMVKSEAIDIFKHASTSKTQLAAKISKFAKDGTIPQGEEEDEFDAFNS